MDGPMGIWGWIAIAGLALYLIVVAGAILTGLLKARELREGRRRPYNPDDFGAGAAGDRAFSSSADHQGRRRLSAGLVPTAANCI
jgi:hypothetical protein